MANSIYAFTKSNLLSSQEYTNEPRFGSFLKTVTLPSGLQQRTSQVGEARSGVRGETPATRPLLAFLVGGRGCGWAGVKPAPVVVPTEFVKYSNNGTIIGEVNVSDGLSAFKVGGKGDVSFKDDGYCYLSLFAEEDWQAIREDLGPNPTLGDLAYATGCKDYAVVHDPYVEVYDGLLHLTYESDSNLIFSELLNSVEVAQVDNFNVGKRKKMGKFSRQTALSGKGDFKNFMKKVGKALKPVGKALKPIGQKLLNKAGQMGKNYIDNAANSLLLGMGDYRTGKSLSARLMKLAGSGDYEMGEKVAVNSLFPGGAASGSANASFASIGDTTRVKHREYLCDIFTGPIAGAFNIDSFPINPGILTSFPYAAHLAANFEEYRFHGLVFEFISSTSPFNSAGAMGTAIMAAQYNANSPPFVNKSSMENSDFALSQRFDKSMMYGFECAMNTQNTYYVRTGYSSLPLTTTDIGTFFFATQPAATFPVNSTLGELWVSYDIELMRPHISTTDPGYVNVYVTGTVTGDGEGGSTITSATATVLRSSGSLSFTTATALPANDVLTVSVMMPPIRQFDNLLVSASAALNETLPAVFFEVGTLLQTGLTPGAAIYPTSDGGLSYQSGLVAPGNYSTQLTSATVDGSVQIGSNNKNYVQFNLGIIPNIATLTTNFAMTIQIANGGFVSV